MDLQEAQYEDSKTSLSYLCAQISKMKTEKSIIRNEIKVLKTKVASLK